MVDADKPEISDIMDRKSVRLFECVRFGSGRGSHDYLIVDGLERKTLVRSGKVHYGDIQFSGIGNKSSVRDQPTRRAAFMKSFETFRSYVAAKDLRNALKDFIRASAQTD